MSSSIECIIIDSMLSKHEINCCKGTFFLEKSFRRWNVDGFLYLPPKFWLAVYFYFILFFTVHLLGYLFYCAQILSSILLLLCTDWLVCFAVLWLANNFCPLLMNQNATGTQFCRQFSCLLLALEDKEGNTKFTKNILISSNLYYFSASE